MSVHLYIGPTHGSAPTGPVITPAAELSSVSREFEVVIVGAGPAGAACALELSSSGVETALLEKESIPRAKLCAGGLSHRARDFLGLDVSGAIQNKVEAVEFLGHHRLRLRKESHAIFGWIADRSKFDAAIVNEAKKAGCQVLDRTAIRKVDLGDRKARLTSANGDSVTARYVVGADGALSAVRRSLGIPKLRRRGVTVMFELKPVDGATFDGGLIQFDFGVIPYGYLWVFPRGDRLSVGAMTSLPALPRARARVASYVAEDEALSSGFEMRFSGGLVVPYWTGERAVGKGDCVLAGDAAGFIDSFLGEGLSWAIRGGQLAAKAILQIRATGASPRSLHSVYRSLLKRDVLSELKKAYWFGRIAYRHPEFVFKGVSRLAGNTELFAKIAQSKTSYKSLVVNLMKHLLLPK